MTEKCGFLEVRAPEKAGEAKIRRKTFIYLKLFFLNYTESHFKQQIIEIQSKDSFLFL